MVQLFPLLPLPFLEFFPISPPPPPYTFLLYVHLLGTFIYQSGSSSFSYCFLPSFSVLFLSSIPVCGL